MFLPHGAITRGGTDFGGWTTITFSAVIGPGIGREHAWGRHTRHGLRENGGGRSRAARHARRGRTRLKIRFEVEHEHEREE